FTRADTVHAVRRRPGLEIAYGRPRRGDVELLARVAIDDRVDRRRCLEAIEAADRLDEVVDGRPDRWVTKRFRTGTRHHVFDDQEVDARRQGDRARRAHRLLERAHDTWLPPGRDLERHADRKPR